MKRGKKYKAVSPKVERGKLYPLTEAVKLAKETSYSNFDGTIGSGTSGTNGFWHLFIVYAQIPLNVRFF